MPVIPLAIWLDLPHDMLACGFEVALYCVQVTEVASARLALLPRGHTLSWACILLDEAFPYIYAVLLALSLGYEATVASQWALLLYYQSSQQLWDGGHKTPGNTCHARCAARGCPAPPPSLFVAYTP